VLRAVRLIVVALLAASPAAANVDVDRGFPAGECTAWAYSKRPGIVDLTVLRNLKVTPSTGQATQRVANWDAWLWAANARKGGFAVGARPAVGAVAVWPRNTDGAGPVGHVAYVEKVLAGGAFAFSEQNWNGHRNVTRRVVASDRSLRFIYGRGGEPMQAGTGQLRRLWSSQGADGKTPSAVLQMSGRADVLLRLIGPRGLSRDAARILPAGTSTIALSEIAGVAALAPGNYALVVVVVGGGSAYRYSLLYVPGS
jgi:hypothetical protein